MKEKQFIRRNATIWVMVAVLLLSVAVPTSLVRAEETQPQTEISPSEAESTEAPEQKQQKEPVQKAVNKANNKKNTVQEESAQQSQQAESGPTENKMPEKPAKQQATGLRLNKTVVTVTVGNSTRLKATVSPKNAENKVVKWTSSNKKIATVTSKGLVKAVRQGTVYITAKTANGKKATCKIKTKLKKASNLHSKCLSYRQIKIFWKPVTNADGYDIFRRAKNSRKYIRINKYGIKKSKTSYVDKGRTTGARYYYKVRAYQVVDGKRRNGELSNSTAYRTIRPATPKIRVKAGAGRARISWNKVAGTSKYTIYRARSRKGKYTKIATVSAKKRTYLNTGLRGGKKYYYKVKSYRKVKGKKVYSLASDVKAVKPKKPKRPYNSSHNFYYKNKFTVKVYAYSGGGYTAMGTRARVGEIAVDPRVIPLGTRVYVNGYGFARAEDTGGNIKGRTIDAYMNSTSQCYRWGVRYKTIYTNVVRAK